MRVTCWLALFWLAAGCQAAKRQVAPTQVVVRIDASEQLRQTAKLLSIRAAVQNKPNGKWSERAPIELSIGKKNPGQRDFWPVDIPVSPRDPASPPHLFEVVIEARTDGDAPALVQARVLTGFVQASELLLTVMLEACGDQPLGSLCESDMSCHGTDCRSCQDGTCASNTQVIAADTLAALDPNISTGGRGGDSGAAAHSGSNAMVATGSGETWSAAARVDLGMNAVSQPVAASNPSGDLVVAYRQHESEPSGFLWLRRFVGDAWDERAFAPNGTYPLPTQSIMPAKLGIDDAGGVQLLYDDGQHATKWLRWNGETSLTEANPPRVLGTQKRAADRMLSVTGGGLATALWVEYVEDRATTARDVYLNRLSRDGWARPMKIGDTGATLRAHGFAENGTGDFVAVFGAYDTEANGTQRPNVVRSFVGVAGDVSTPGTFTIDDPTFSAAFPCVLDSGGNATLLFLAGADSDSMQLFWSRYVAGAEAWTQPAPLSERRVYQGDIIAIGSEGAVAIWQDLNDANPERGRIVVRRYDPSGAWSAVEEITSELSILDESVGLSATPTGGVMAVWTEPRPGSSASSKLLRYSRSSGTGTWSEPATIAEVAKDAAIVKLTVNSDDRALIVWSESDEASVQHLKWSRSSR